MEDKQGIRRDARFQVDVTRALLLNAPQPLRLIENAYFPAMPSCLYLNNNFVTWPSYSRNKGENPDDATTPPRCDVTATIVFLWLRGECIGVNTTSELRLLLLCLYISPCIFTMHSTIELSNGIIYSADARSTFSDNIRLLPWCRQVKAR